MAGLWSWIEKNYDYVFYELCDERTRDSWPSTGILATILVAYLYFCTKVGPTWMQHKKPYDLTNIIFYYNVFQVIFSTYLFYASSYLMALYDFFCQPVSYHNTPENKTAQNLIRIYLVLKLIELLDTIFFVLRKKTRQVSTLHLFHHTLMPTISYISYKYYPNGHQVFIGWINCFVHIIMYSYYLIAGLGPQYQKYLWWKRYVTLLQMVQFFMIFVHNLLPLMCGCDFPKWINVGVCIISLQFVYMFGNFYYINYIKTAKKNNT